MSDIDRVDKNADRIEAQFVKHVFQGYSFVYPYQVSDNYVEDTSRAYQVM